MKLIINSPVKSLGKAYLKQSLKREQIEHFKANLARMFERIRTDEHEEHLKNTGWLCSLFLAVHGTTPHPTRHRLPESPRHRARPENPCSEIPPSPPFLKGGAKPIAA
jgi:hypothetical protein